MNQTSAKTGFIFIGALTALAGAIVVLGWLYDVTVVRSVFLSGATMKLNTAACFMALGLAMVLGQFKRHRVVRIAYVVLSFLVLFIALLSLSEYLFAWTAGLDEWFVKDTASRTAGILHPGLMSPLTALCFSLISAALLAGLCAKPFVLRIAQYALHVAMFISAIALFGYLFHAPTFYQFSFFTSIAVHTAFLIFIFSITASLLHPTLGITGLFTGHLSGHIMIRRLFVWFTLLLVAINFFTIRSIEGGLLEYHFAIVLSGLVAILVFLFLISLTAVTLNQTDARRREAEGRLQQLNAELEEKVAERSRQLTDVNQALSQQNELLESQNIALAEANVELTSFTHIASHDLKEPLRKVTTYISAIETESGEQFSPRSRDYFRRVVDASGRMGTLIDDLLNFSKINTTADALLPIDLNVLLKDVQGELQEVMAEKEAVIQVQHLPTVQGVSFQLHQLFTNLITNAIKYSKADVSPCIKITDGTVDETILREEFPGAKGTYHRIGFEDNGIGFSPEYRHKVFELFQRLHSRNKYSGTGVGLAICKKVMDHHNGYITAEGEPGVGAKFTVYLPCRERR